MKRIILDQALSLLCAGILMFGIPFACNGVILPIVIMEAIVLFNTVLLYPIALFLPLDLILGPRTEEAFFSRRALTRKTCAGFAEAMCMVFQIRNVFSCWIIPKHCYRKSRT